jgi:hypothetical protein
VVVQHHRGRVRFVIPPRLGVAGVDLHDHLALDDLGLFRGARAAALTFGDGAARGQGLLGDTDDLLDVRDLALLVGVARRVDDLLAAPVLERRIGYSLGAANSIRDCTESQTGNR